MWMCHNNLTTTTGWPLWTFIAFSLELVFSISLGSSRLSWHVEHLFFTKLHIFYLPLLYNGETMDFSWPPEKGRAGNMSSSVNTVNRALLPLVTIPLISPFIFFYGLCSSGGHKPIYFCHSWSCFFTLFGHPLCVLNPQAVIWEFSIFDSRFCISSLPDWSWRIRYQSRSHSNIFCVS